MIKLLILSLVSSLTAIINSYIDSSIIKKKWGKIKSLDHITRTAIRFCIFTTSAYLLYQNIYFLIGLTFEFLVFWLLFDLCMDYWREKMDLLYIKNTSFLDKKLSNVPEYLIIELKASLIVIFGIWVYLI